MFWKDVIFIAVFVILCIVFVIHFLVSCETFLLFKISILCLCMGWEFQELSAHGLWFSFQLICKTKHPFCTHRAYQLLKREGAAFPIQVNKKNRRPHLL